MSDLSQLSDEQLLSLINQQQQQEQPSALPPEFESEFIKATKFVKPSELGTTPREVLDSAVAQGIISPTFSTKGSDEFSKEWETYKKEMQPSMAGAALRGASRAIIPTAGGIVGGLAGSTAGPVGTVGGAIAGGMAGEALQEKMFPMTESEKAQAMFDAVSAGTRYSRMAGEIVPQFVTAKPSISTIGKALSGDLIAKKSLAIGAGMGAAIPAGISAARGEVPDIESLVFNAVAGAALEPNKLGTKLFDKKYRAELAAKEAASKTLQAFTTDIESTKAKLTEAADLTQGGVKPLSGDVVGDEGFLGLQQALRNRDSELRARDVKNVEAIAKNINQAMEQGGATPAKAQEIFASQNEQLLNQAQQAFDGLIKQGDVQSANIIRQAMDSANEQLDLAKAGERTAESANAIISNYLDRAQAQISLNRGQQNPAGETVLSALKSEESLARANAQEPYRQLTLRGVTANLDNAIAAGNIIKSEIPRMDSLPPKVRDFLDTYDGTPVPASELLSIIQSVSGAISEQRGPGGNANTARLLTKLKDGLLLDLDALGNLSSEVKAANANYKAYADKYLNDYAGAVLGDRVDATKTIDHYAASKEGFLQLRAGLNNRPEAINAVSEWIYGQMLDSNRGNPTSRSIQNWMTGRQAAAWLDVFPEAAPRINADIASLAAMENQLSSTQLAIARAKEVKAEAKLSATEQKKEASALSQKLKSETKEQAQTAFQEQKKAIQNSSATLFIGSAPEIAIGQVINSNNPVVYMQELVARASQDPTGQALEGVKNALKNYLNVTIRNVGKVATTENVLKPITTADLPASLAKMNELMVDNSNTRSAIEVLFGKNSPELNALDLARRQLEVVARRLRAAGGQSVTGLSQMLEGNVASTLQDNVLGFLGRIATAATPAEVRRIGGEGGTRRLFDALNFALKGDVAKKAQGLLVNAMLDPAVAAELLNPVNKDTIQRSASWIRSYPSSGNVLPFNPINSSEEQINDGRVITDSFTGFRIVDNGSGKYRLYNDRGSLEGIYSSIGEAHQASVKKLYGSK